MLVLMIEMKQINLLERMTWQVRAILHGIGLYFKLIQRVDSTKSLLILWNLVFPWSDEATELVDCSEFEGHLGLVNAFDVVAQQVVVGDAVELLLKDLLCRLPLVQVEQLPVSRQDFVVDLAEVFVGAFSLRVDVDDPWNSQFDWEHRRVLSGNPSFHDT